MKLTPKDIEGLRSALSATKVVGVEGIVFSDGKVMGARISLDAAIISASGMDFNPEYRLGVGRVDELEKRLALFSGPIEIDAKVSDAGDVSLLTITSGKTKVQFRCTSAALMKYPKKNNDPAFAVVYLSRAEAQQASKAAKSLKSDRLLLQVGRDGNVRLECVDSSNDRFEIELAKQADYMDEADSAVHSYIANVLTDVLDAAAKDAEEISLILGADGSITTTARGHELIVFPQINGEEE